MSRYWFAIFMSIWLVGLSLAGYIPVFKVLP